MSGPQIFMFHLGFSFATLAGTAASISAAADIVLLICRGRSKNVDTMTLNPAVWIHKFRHIALSLSLLPCPTSSSQPTSEGLKLSTVNTHGDRSQHFSRRSDRTDF